MPISKQPILAAPNLSPELPVSAVSSKKSISPWRIFSLGNPTDPLWNMAVDEMFLNQKSLSLPIIRFYQWSEETYSVGYFQNPEKIAKEYDCESKGIRVVRRITGGGLVHHKNDLTISFVLPEKNPWIPLGVSESYRTIHSWIREALELFLKDISIIRSSKGLSPRNRRECFEDPTCFDIEHEGKKIVGSSQRRRGGHLLHQTAIMTSIDPQLLSKQLIDLLRTKINVEMKGSVLNKEELEGVHELVSGKYSRSNFSF